MAHILPRAFTEHPAAVGETYGQHCAHAFGFGCRMVLGGLACMVHAVCPSLFICTGSQTIQSLYDRMIVHRKAQLRTSGDSAIAHTTAS